MRHEVDTDQRRLSGKPRVVIDEAKRFAVADRKRHQTDLRRLRL